MDKNLKYFIDKMIDKNHNPTWIKRTQPMELRVKITCRKIKEMNCYLNTMTKDEIESALDDIVDFLEKGL